MIPSVDQCKTELERVSRQRRLSEPVQFGHLRWEALDRFLSLGFPTASDEGWAFTSVASIADTIFTMGAEPADGARHLALAPFHLPGVFGAELVFVNGFYMPGVSTTGTLPPGVRVEALSAVIHASDEDLDSYLAHVAPFEQLPFVALNTALFMDGACIRIAARTAVPQPIHVRFISTGEADMRPAMSHPRVLVLLDDDSQATIVQSYAGPEGVAYFTNVVTEIVVGERARLDHYTLQHESMDASHINATYMVAARGARCSAHTVSLGGALVRSDLVALLGGEDGQYTINTLSLADGQRLVDHHTTVDHAMPHGRSRQHSSFILADQATGVSAGTIAVRAEADHTSATQTNRTLLLSDEARIHSIPQLEILANDVNWAQRAVVRRIDGDTALGMRTRGVGDAEGRRLAICRFADHALGRLTLEPLRNRIRDIIRRQLERGHGNTA